MSPQVDIDSGTASPSRLAGGPLVVVYDPITTIRWDYDHERSELEQRGVRFRLLKSDTDRADLLAEADVVVVSSRLADADLATLTNCIGIVCYSVGLDGVNRAMADAMGIRVVNIPGYCTEEVSDHAIALLLAVQRLIVPCATAAAAGSWDVRGRDDFYKLRRLAETTVGVIGVGRIGRRTAEKARGLGMRTLGYDPMVDQAEAPGVEMVGLSDLLTQSDAVVLCASLTPNTQPLMGTAEFDLMRDDAVLVNVARGGLVDEAALAVALRSGRLRAAALDVRTNEPPDPDRDPLRRLDNVVLTQHTASVSIESSRDIHAGAVEQILSLLREAKRLPAANTEA